MFCNSSIENAAMGTQPRISNQPKDFRRGTATVELALCLPVIVLLLFGAIEVAHFIHLKQDLTVCAYEAGKVANRRGTTQADVVARFQEIAGAKGLEKATVTITPLLTALTPSGTEISLTAQAPANDNYELPSTYFRNRTLQATVVVIRQQY